MLLTCKQLCNALVNAAIDRLSEHVCASFHGFCLFHFNVIWKTCVNVRKRGKERKRRQTFQHYIRSKKTLSFHFLRASHEWPAKTVKNIAFDEYYLYMTTTRSIRVGLRKQGGCQKEIFYPSIQKEDRLRNKPCSTLQSVLSTEKHEKNYLFRPDSWRNRK